MANTYENWTATDTIEKSLLDNNVHYLNGEITNENVSEAIKWIISQEFIPSKKQLTLYVNTTGGDLYECFALIDVMKKSKHTISTIGIGAVMSAGFLIFISGEKGKRFLGKNTGIMTHQHTDDWSSKMHDLRACMEENANCETRALQIITDASDMTLAQVKQKFNSPTDQYFTAKEMVKFKLADKIL